jgi:ABC-type transport system involved in multi-copper enzyme maturation permease subunit
VRPLPPLLVVARLTLVEASRRKLLLALLVLTLAVIAGSAWGFSRLWDAPIGGRGQPPTPAIVRSVASQLLILVAFMFEAVLALSAAVVAAPTIAADVESGLVLAVLARPMRRADFLLGKWLGLSVLLVGYTVLAAWGEIGAVYWATGYVPPHPLLLTAYISGVGLVLLTLSLALSTRLSGITGAVIALAAYFVAWVGGIIGGVGQALNNQALTVAGTATKLLLPTDGLWHGAVWSMEPAVIIAGYRSAGAAAAGNPFGATDAPPAAFDVWAVAWVAAMLAIAVWSFQKREI